MNYIEEIAKLRLDIETPEDKVTIIKVKKEKKENDRRGYYVRTPETRERHSIAQKGLLWWTNGVIETKAKECPKGMKRGRLPIEHAKGLLWWTNGEKTTTSKECPGDGWYRGRNGWHRGRNKSK